MKTNRRSFFKKTAMGTIGGSLLINGCNPDSQKIKTTDYSQLDKILSTPVLKTSLFPAPVIIEQLELRRYKKNFICIVKSKEGAEGISVSNNMQMLSLYPIFIKRLQPFFIGKDAVKLEQLLEDVYVYQANYKLQSLALWVPLATIEFAILDMLGKIAGHPVGKLIGEIHNPKIGVYRANNYRGETAEESIKKIIENVESSKARAVKFKIGGRMSNAEYPPGRTEALIPLVRKTFGEGMTIYADSNGSYTVDEAIRIGKILEEYKIDFYEEPTPFDWYEETKQVADALTVPVAGGEQEASMHNFRWLIGNNALDIVQPDIFYFGGMIRSMKVALMANAGKKMCIPHISGSGLGYLYMMHFVSAIPNAGPYHEFKGFNNNIPLTSKSSNLEINDGSITVPTDPGLGVTIDPDYLAKHELIHL